jgi:hypothetical protein
VPTRRFNPVAGFCDRGSKGFESIALTSPSALTFDHVLRYGLGRAVLMLEQGDSAFRRSFRRAIIAACRRSDAFEPQIEDHRGAYLFDVIQATGEPDYYAGRLRTILGAHRETDCWLQLMDLMARFARLGDDNCRGAVYRAFEDNISAGYVLGEDLLVELDGIKGYCFVVRCLGAHPEVEDDIPHYLCFDELLKRTGLSAVAAADTVRKCEPGAAAYVENVLRDWQKWQEELPARRNAPWTPQTYDSIRAAIDAPKKHLPTPAASHRLNEADFRRLAEELVMETDAARQAKYLKLFLHRAFPLGPEPLLALVESNDFHVSWRAVSALELLTAPVLRARCLAWSNTAGQERASAALRVSNPGDGDIEWFTEVLHRDLDEDTFHDVLMAFRNYVEKWIPRQAVPLMIRLYERTRCGLCRSHLVELLAGVGALPEWLIEEGLYDADTGIREVAAYTREVSRSGRGGDE